MGEINTIYPVSANRGLYNLKPASKVSIKEDKCDTFTGAVQSGKATPSFTGNKVGRIVFPLLGGSALFNLLIAKSQFLQSAVVTPLCSKPDLPHQAVCFAATKLPAIPSQAVIEGLDAIGKFLLNIIK